MKYFNVDAEEIKFLENYYNFFKAKNPTNTLSDFEKSCKVLVASNQVTMESLKFFIEKCGSNDTIKEKLTEITRLENQILTLKKEIVAIEKKFDLRNSSRDSVSDSCGHSSRRTSGC